MDRADLSSASRQEMQGVVSEALATVVPELLTVDLATLEQRVQQGGRVILGGLRERVAAGQAQGLPRPARGPTCQGTLKLGREARQSGGIGEPARGPTCQGTLKRRERERPLVGLVGDDTLRRPY